MAAASPVLQLGLLRMRPLQHWLKPQVPPHAWLHIRVSQAGVTAFVIRADTATYSSPLARAPETGSPLSSKRDNMAPSARAVGSSTLAARREPTSLPERVLNTISEASVLSTDAPMPLNGPFSPPGPGATVYEPSVAVAKECSASSTSVG